MSPQAPKPKATPKAAPKSKATPKPKATRARRPPRVRLDRLRSGEAIALVAAILLFVLMFFDWFELGIGHVGLNEVNLFDRGQDAWQALEVIPLFLMLAIAVAVGAAILRLGGSGWRPAISPGAAVCVLGALAALLIVIRIVSPPDLAPPAFAGSEFDTTLQLPVFLALAAALGIAYGGWRTMAAEGTSFAQIAKKLESPRRPAKPKSKPAAKPAGGPKS